MNKLDYLGQLESILKKQHMSKADIDDIIRDYAEFFEEGRRQGQSDGEICAKLGSPELVAEQILEENGHNVAITPAPPKNDFKMPKMPKFEWKPREKQPKNRKNGGLGSVLTLLIKLLVLLMVLPALAIVFGCAAIGLGCGFLGLICLFIAVILGFFAASMVTHFLTLPVTIFAICVCIALLSLIVCLGALLIMLTYWCGKLFLLILRELLEWIKPPVKTAAEPENHTTETEETIPNEEGELYE